MGMCSTQSLNVNGLLSGIIYTHVLQVNMKECQWPKNLLLLNLYNSSALQALCYTFCFVVEFFKKVNKSFEKCCIR